MPHSLNYKWLISQVSSWDNTLQLQAGSCCSTWQLASPVDPQSLSGPRGPRDRVASLADPQLLSSSSPGPRGPCEIWIPQLILSFSAAHHLDPEIHVTFGFSGWSSTSLQLIHGHHLDPEGGGFPGRSSTSLQLIHSHHLDPKGGQWGQAGQLGPENVRAEPALNASSHVHLISTSAAAATSSMCSR